MTKYNLLFHLMCALLIFMSIMCAYADIINVKVHGIVQPTPCKINNNEDIIVNFHEMRKIDVLQKDIEKIVSIPISCSIDFNNVTLYLSVNTLLSNAVLQTSNPGIGIKFLQMSGNQIIAEDSHKFRVCRILSSSQICKFLVKIYPIDRDKISLGEFSATATAAIEYN